MIPPMLIGLAHITIYMSLRPFWSSPSPAARIGSACSTAARSSFSRPSSGIGLFISSLCATQQQAILGAFLFLAPATLLSGFATPIENMPAWLQPITMVNPLRYFLVVTRGVFLKAMPFSEVVKNTLPLLAIAVVTLTASAWLFRRRTE